MYINGGDDMFEQILQLKDRYEKMVSRVTKEDMTTWSADFFAQYPFVVSIAWEQVVEDFHERIAMLEVEVTPGYASTHTELPFKRPMLADGNEQIYINPLMLTKEERKIYTEFRAAAAELERLFEAQDILMYVFKVETYIKMTKDEIVVEELEDA